MNNKQVASELVKIARSLIAMEFRTQDALDNYMRQHPEGDESNHKVVPTKEIKDLSKHVEKMDKQTRTNLKHGLELLKKGEHNKARSYFKKLDTAVIDKLPISIRNLFSF